MGHIKAISTILVTLLVSYSKQDGLDNFVKTKMDNFPAWLKDNNLDPSPLVPGPTSIPASNVVVNLECSLSNHGIQGHSGEINVYDVITDLLNGWFRVRYIVRGDISFFGSYAANGTLLSTQPIEGQGSWHIQVSSFSTNDFDIYFEVSPAGFLNMTEHDLYMIGLGETREIYFENLSDNDAAAGYEEFINGALLEGFKNYLDNDRSPAQHPIRALFLKYWQEILEETTLADIIGSTTAPPTTTEPTTTVDPCRNVNDDIPSELGHLRNTNVLDRKIEQETRLDADGVPFVVTKTTVFTRERKEL